MSTLVNTQTQGMQFNPNQMNSAPTNIPRFTLLEVLLAIALVAVVTGVALRQPLRGLPRPAAAATDRLDVIRAARLTMDAIGRDLLSALPPSGVLIQTFTGQDGMSLPAASGAGDTISFIAPTAERPRPIQWETSAKSRSA